MSTLHLLYNRQIDVNDSIHIMIPEVGQVLECEDAYYGMVSLLTAMPIDMIAQLDDAGIDFTSINEWELFLLTFPEIQKQDTSLVFGDLDLTKFKIVQRESNGTFALLDEDSGVIIDRPTHGRIAAKLRGIHHLERNNRTPGNEEAKRYLIERARAKLKRAKHRTEASQLESLIIGMVNTEQYKYNYEETKKLTIYQFNESVRQVVHKVEFDWRMYGVYTGTIDAKKLSEKDLRWMP